MDETDLQSVTIETDEKVTKSVAIEKSKEITDHSVTIGTVESDAIAIATDEYEGNSV